MAIPFKQYGNLLSAYLKPQQGRVIKLAIALFSSIGFLALNLEQESQYIELVLLNFNHLLLQLLLLLLNY